MAKIYHNGLYINSDQFNLNPADRGLLLGDGLFETIFVAAQHICSLSEHWQRFSAGATQLELPLPLTLHELKNIIKKLLLFNNLEKAEARVRITLTRGSGAPGLNFPLLIKPTLMVQASAYTDVSKPCWTAHLASIKRNEYSPLSSIKSLNYLESVLARTEALKNHADEALLANTHNNIVCASCANLFMIRDSILITPPLTDGALPGIIRAKILKLAALNHVPVKIASINLQSLMNAEEIFITNSLIKIKPIVKINQILIGTGEIGRLTLQFQSFLKKSIKL